MNKKPLTAETIIKTIIYGIIIGFLVFVPLGNFILKFINATLFKYIIIVIIIGLIVAEIIYYKKTGTLF